MSLVRQICEGELKRRGYARAKGGVWILEQDELKHLALLTHSRFGPEYEVNFGIVVNGYEPEVLNVPIKWLLLTSPETLADNPQAVMKLFKDDSGIEEEDRASGIAAAFDLIDREFFGRFRTKADVKNYPQNRRKGIDVNERRLAEVV